MRDKYFSASRDMAAYAKYSGKDPGNYLPKMAELMEDIINKAYRDGFTAGAMDALAAEEAKQKQT